MSHHVRAFENVPSYFRDRLYHERFWAGTNRILEVGCSVGMFLGYGNRVGMDVDEEAISIARSRGFEAVYGSVLDIPFCDAEFDGVECREVLEHVSDPAKGIRELFRVLKPGGKLLIEVPDIRKVKWDFWENYEHVYPFTLESIRELVIDSGGKNVKAFHGYRGIWGSRFLSVKQGLKVQDLMRKAGLTDRNILVTANH